MRRKGGTGGLVDGDLQIEFVAPFGFQVVVDLDRKFQSGSVHDSAAAGGGGVDLDGAFADNELFVKVFIGDPFSEVAAHFCKSGIHFALFPVAGGGVHHFREVKSDHGHTGFQSHVDIGNGFQMVAVGTPSQLVVAFEDTEDGIIHHRAEGTVGHGKFPHGLLGDHRGNLELHSSSNMSGGGETETVAASHGGLHIAQTLGSAPGKMLTQSSGIGAVEFAHQSGAAVGDGKFFTGKTGGKSLFGVSNDQQEALFAVASHHNGGIADLVN